MGDARDPGDSPSADQPQRPSVDEVQARLHATGEIEMAPEDTSAPRLQAATVVTGEHRMLGSGGEAGHGREYRLAGMDEPSDARARTLNIEDETFRNKVRWVTVLRILVIALLLTATVLLQQGSVGGLFGASARTAVYTLAIVMYLASAAYLGVLLVAEGPRAWVRLTWVQLAFDLIFASGIVVYTGGTGSVFSFFFSLAVVTAAILLYRRGALVVATGATLAFVAMGLLELSPGLRGGAEPYVGWLIPMSAFDRANSDTTVYNIAVNAIAFYAIAFLSSYLSEQLRAAARRIQFQATTLENLEDLLNSIISTIPIGVVTTDSSGMVSFMNPEALRICGREVDQVLGYRVTRIFPDLRHILANPTKHGRAVNEITSQFLGGEVRLLRWTITPLLEHGRDIEGELLVFEDITDLVTLQREMQESRHLAAIGKLAAGVAHEIRNPLGAISGCVQLLRRVAAKDKEMADRVRLMDIILRETEHLNRWIGEFLAYARPKPPKLTPLDLVRLARDTVLLAQQEQGAGGKDAARVDFNEDQGGMMDATVHADGGQLRQVIWNLIRNAREAMEDQQDGRIEVSVSPVDEGDGPLIVLRVTDNGPGIEPEDQASVFEPFFTTRERGTGLGLATVHRIVQNHGGSVRLHSTPDKGTTFDILLPPLSSSGHRERAYP